MTKTVRIENADTNTTKRVVATVWQKGHSGAPDTEVRTVNLGHPTALHEFTLHDSNYVVIREETIE